MISNFLHFHDTIYFSSTQIIIDLALRILTDKAQTDMLYNILADLMVTGEVKKISIFVLF